MNNIIAFCRVSTDSQIIENQEFEIRNYASEHKLHISEFIKITQASTSDYHKREISKLLSLQKGDIILVTELSRLGRKAYELMNLIEILGNKGVSIICVRDNTEINQLPKETLQLIAQITEAERLLISERTKVALARLKADGKTLGRPKGSYGPSKLDPHVDEIRRMLKARVPVSAIARLLNCSRTTLIDYIKKMKELGMKELHKVEEIQEVSVNVNGKIYKGEVSTKFIRKPFYKNTEVVE